MNMIVLLAALEYQRWTLWARSLFLQGVFNEDGTWTLPAVDVGYWQRQIDKPFYALSDEEKDRSRREARRILVMLQEEV